MKYEGMIIRPPSEAESLLLQVTVGCSHNRCAFCPTYRGKRFRIKTFPEIEEDILEAGRGPSVKRVFLCDGDALIIPQARLLEILASVQTRIPGVQRISTYANAKSILRKSPEELAVLRACGLKMVYLGVESGHEGILKQIDKGVSPQQMVEAGRRIRDAGMILSVTVILGLGGAERSVEHALDTAGILTQIDPDYVGALTLMLVEGTPLAEAHRRGDFVMPDVFGILRELSLILGNACFSDCLFTANHASNYLPLRARLPEEREIALRVIEGILSRGERRMLKPEFLRAL